MRSNRKLVLTKYWASFLTGAATVLDIRGGGGMAAFQPCVEAQPQLRISSLGGSTPKMASLSF